MQVAGRPLLPPPFSRERETGEVRPFALNPTYGFTVYPMR
jgi:hypothetical protein